MITFKHEPKILDIFLIWKTTGSSHGAIHHSPSTTTAPDFKLRVSTSNTFLHMIYLLNFQQEKKGETMALKTYVMVKHLTTLNMKICTPNRTDPWKWLSDEAQLTDNTPDLLLRRKANLSFQCLIALTVTPQHTLGTSPTPQGTSKLHVQTTHATFSIPARAALLLYKQDWICIIRPRLEPHFQRQINGAHPSSPLFLMSTHHRKGCTT